jgi:hypothetical protein
VNAVRPEGSDSESDDEEEEQVVIEGTVGERIRGEREEEKVKVIADPRKPTEKEVEKHCLTHLPYRNWCPVCVAGKGKDLDHRKDVRQDRGVYLSSVLIIFFRETILDID